jgi:teichuronic acid biosynthesis glycosyltransferase TuaC
VRVLLLSSLYPNAAQPRRGQFVRERLRQMQRRYDIDWTVVAPVPWFPFPQPRFGAYAEFARVPAEEVSDGVRVLHPRYPVVPKVGDAITPLGYARSVARCLRRHRLGADLVDAHFFFPDGVAAVLLGRRLGLPTVVTARGSDINHMPDEAVAGRWIRWAAPRASRLVAVSRPLAERLQALAGGAAVTVAPNGVDTGRFRPSAAAAELRKRLGVRGRLVLSAGNLIELKGHHLVIEAVRELPDTTLLIAGEGPWRAKLEAMIRQNGLTERARLLGALPQEALIDHYAAADLLVLASRSEGSPNVVLEALACGTPVIATVDSAVPDGASARDVRRVERSVAALREAMAAHPGGATCRSEVRERALALDWDATCAALYDVFAGAVRGRREANP